MISGLLAPTADLITDLILKFNYPGIIFATALENIIVPIPSEFVFPWAGFLASQGNMNILLISLSGAIGSVIAASILYHLGSKFNGPKTRQFIDKHGKYLLIKLADLEKAEKWFEKYGSWTVLVFRVVPLGRSLISIPAGFIKMDFMVFSIYTFIGTFVWSFILTYTGYILGENWTKVSGVLSEYENVVVLSIVLTIVAFLYFKRKDLPLIGKLFSKDSNRDKV